MEAVSLAGIRHKKQEFDFRDTDQPVKRHPRIQKTFHWVMRSYNFNEGLKKFIRQTLKDLFETEELAYYGEVYTCYKELVSNAVKANYKNLYQDITRKNSIDMDGRYLDFIHLFRGELQEKGESKLLTLAQESNSYIECILERTSSTLEFYVSNFQQMQQIEINRIKEKLDTYDRKKRAMTSQDDPLREGAGMGIYLIRSLMEKLNCPEDALMIKSQKGKTTVGLKLKLADLKNNEEQAAD